MLQAIGDTLPLAVGISISPLATVTVILTLMSPRATRNSVIFVAGWLLGLVTLLTGFTLLGQLLDESDSDASKPITGTVKIVLGLGLLYLSWLQWRGRPAPGQAAEVPGWLQAIDTFGPTKLAGLGLFFTLGAPKNIMLTAAAGKTSASQISQRRNRLACSR